ncbi:MAG: stage III sporulation protein AA [Peptococcaceae bacterium BRH_c4a]|nr:MAG: stage III sporulation protein AA [Peptococcaceae bacterium BRH_c4a]
MATTTKDIFSGASRGGDAWPEVLSVLPLNLRKIIAGVRPEILCRVEEVRIRALRPLMLGLDSGDAMLTDGGALTDNLHKAYRVGEEEVGRCLQLISGSSIYALEEEIRNGFITILGGHRVGLTGKTVLDQGKVKTLKYFSGINIRISREITGSAGSLMPRIIDREGGTIHHTMIFSPPRCGKTTVLRDAVRMISDGAPECGLPGQVVGLVDERSEIAGCYRGIPRRNIGIRTDVLDGCPKAEGMVMLLRSMGPSVIATDEIGRPEDVRALEEVLNAGVRVIFTVHGSSLEELAVRPALNYLFRLNMIDRYVLLGRDLKAGLVKGVFDRKSIFEKGVVSC